MNPRDRTADPLAHLHFVLETLPGSRKYAFTSATRAEILSELYGAFWGPYAHMFLPNNTSSLPLHATLSEIQTKLGYAGAGKEDPVIPGRPCGHIFNKGESCFRCKDCSLDDSCVLCSRCFHATSHVNHNVSFFIAQQSGGCCDCGDEEAWRNPIGCPFHPPSPEEDEDDFSFQSTPRAATIPLLDDIPPVRGYPFRVPVPAELREIMSRTIGYALDFMLDTLDYSPDDTSAPSNEADLRTQPSADPLQKDQYCIVLWNDDKHSFDEVIKLLVDNTGRSREEASEIAHSIDDLGREIIEMSTDVTRLLNVSQTIAQIDLGVTVRRAYDTFREQVVAVIIEWILDLTRSRVGTDAIILREIIGAELLALRKRDGRPYRGTPQASQAVQGLSNPNRLEWMFLYHTKLWKKPRLSLKEVYATVLTLSRPHKQAIAGHFANVYHRIIDTYLLVDREAETSIKYFALQLFTVPSVALHVVRDHNLITRLLYLIAGFFTNQITAKHIAYPPESGIGVDVDSFPFKSKRFMPVFSDLRYLCHNAPVQTLIAQDPSYLAEFANTCMLFMCIGPNKRAAASHVEYETDAWISVFNVTLSLSRVIKVYGEAFAQAAPRQLIDAISTVIDSILAICDSETYWLDREKFPFPTFHEVIFGDVTYKILEFDVLEGWVSFHHSLHWLLSELFKHVHLLGEDSLRTIGTSSIHEALAERITEEDILKVIDYPLRVLAMIAQIRTGLWVRNGFAIRGQLLHYRDFMLRELCYDQDLYLLQTALVIVDPNTVIVSILDRFGLLAYFGGEIAHSTYEGAQLSSMVEEVLYVLITIFSENAHASKMTLPQAVRREIVHALAMGPCTFTDLVKRVAERLVDDVCFERVLKEVSTFRAPESTTDSGMYELKDEVFDEVNPFFYHYTRNKREEVETILENRLKRKTGRSDPVIVPRPLGIASGPFAVLSSCFESEVLLQIMFYTINNTISLTDSSGSPPSSAEAIIDQALHLVMLGLVERPSAFSTLASVKTFDDSRTLIDVLCGLEYHDSYKTYQPRVRWILSKLASHVPEEVNTRRRVPDADQVLHEDPDDARRRAAKARQEAIMIQMKAQQASFATNFDDIDDDEDEDMMDSLEEETSYGTCIVCQEELTFNKPFGTLGMVQPSRLIRRHPDGHNAYLNEVLLTPPSLDRTASMPDTSFPPTTPSPTDLKSQSCNLDGFPGHFSRFGLHASICSHMMHLDCFQVYSASIRQRHRAQATRNHPESIPRKEYICPLCKSLGNCLLPFARPSTATLSNIPFPDWIRAAGISILKSKPDPFLESLQFRIGTGEFVFWSAQDTGYSSAMRSADYSDNSNDALRMVDTMMAVAKNISSQTRHLRDRPEPEPGERGVGVYLPEELVGYTISSIEISLRGSKTNGELLVDSVTESQTKAIRSLLFGLTRIANLYFRGRPDEGKDAIRQAIVKRLLPEWSRTSLTSFSYPLLLRDPFTILVETAAIAPEMLRHVLVLTYYACLARTVIGLVYVLNKTHRSSTIPVGGRVHEDIFGDVRIFFISVVRHSPVFEHTANLVFESFGEARVERLLYAFTLPFLRRAAILCHAVLPNAFPQLNFGANDPCEYHRLLNTLGIPPLSDLPDQDTLQNALSGWCAHYGHSHAASQLNCGVMLDYPGIYRLAKLPLILDDLFSTEKPLTCARCNNVPTDAAICLICGTVCCMQSHCCSDVDGHDRGECNMHTRECGGSIGVYFLVKRCLMLYLYAGNGTFSPSPYLDAHGEVDISMRRGRRQYLHHARWEDARKTWLNHGIPTVVARKLESTVDSGGWETL